jgi:hypothetical protein
LNPTAGTGREKMAKRVYGTGFQPTYLVVPILGLKVQGPVS